MPEWLGNILVVNKEELVPEHWGSYDSLKRSIQRYKDKPYGIKQAQKGGNARRALIKFDSLPAEVQEQIGDPRKPDHILERYFDWDHEAVNFYSTFQYSDKTYLRPATQEQYIVNASVLKAAEQLRQDRTAERQRKGGRLKGINRTLFDDAMSFNDTLLSKWQVTHNLPQNYRRFMDRWKQFSTLGYLALVKDADKKRAHNPRKADKKTVALLNDLFSTQPHKPTAKQISLQYSAFLSGELEVINSDTGELYDPKHFQALSDSTVKRYLGQWENKIGTYAKRSGDRQQYMNQFNPYHSLEQAQWAGSLISIDDRQPPFEMPNGQRVWFYNAIDTASEAFTCWVYGTSKEGIIFNFYRQLLRNYAQWGLGMPWELECELSLNSQFQETFLQPGKMFQDVHIEPNNARAKRIERYFRSLRYDYEKEREGWLARPFNNLESNQPGPGKKQQLEFDKIVKGSLKDIERWNNAPHRKYPEMSRWDYFMQYQHPDLKPINWQSALPYLGNHTQTSVDKGIIRLNYGEFLLGEAGRVSVGDDLIRLMKQVEGKDIDVYWLDDDKGQVLKALIYREGRLICEAIRKPTYKRARLERTADDEMAREVMASYVATINKYGKEQIDEREPLTIIDNRQTEVNHNFQIAELHEDETDEADTDADVMNDEEEENEESSDQKAPRTQPDWRDAFLK